MTTPSRGKEPPVKILLLGPPEIYINNQPVVIKRRLNRALLFYLAAQSHPVARAEVCELFWPGEEVGKGRKKLREALSRLRLELGIPNLIIASSDYLSLEPSLIEVDLLTYQSIINPMLSSAEFNSTGSLPDWIAQELKKALGLCRGISLMQGIALADAAGFEDWLGYHNQSYHVSRLKAIDRLIDHYISSGNLDEAIIWIGVALQSEPLDEELNFLMLICLRDMGRIDEMITFAKYIEGVFNRGGEPIPKKISDLKNQVLQSRDNSGKTDSLWPITEQEAPAFVGRESELDTLNQALRSRGVVLLEGEAGIGKTRLLKQFFTQQAFPPRLFYCAGHPLAKKVGFRSIIDAISTQIHHDEWSGLPETERQMLDHYYHNFLQGDQRYDLPNTESDLLPLMEDVFFAFMRLLEVIASRRPLLFILDDAMWADQASLSLIAFLVEHGFFERYGLLVIAFSPDVLNKPLDLLLQRERRARKLITIHLPPFTNAENNIFIEKVLGRVPGQEDVQRLQILTGGNPYFLSECVRSAQWITSGNQISFPAHDFIPPESIVSLVRDKVNRLEPESVKVLHAAAVLGRKFCSDVIEEMMGIKAEQLADCLDELTNEGFLKVNLEIHPLGGYEFKHDIERVIVLEKISPAKKRNLNLIAARALKKRRGDFPRFSEALALHWETALEHVNALNAWLDAGRYARSQFLKEETYRVYGRALDLITNAPKLYPEQTVYEVINEFGNYAYDRDDVATCQKIYKTCLEIGEVAKNRNLIGTAYNGLGRVAFINNQFDLAEDYLRKANWFLGETGMGVEQIKSVFLLGSIHYSLDNYNECCDWLEKALVYTANLNELYLVDVRIDILAMLCATLCYLGEVKRALELAEEMVNLSSLANRRSALLQAYAVLAMCEYYNDHLEKTIKIYQESLPLVERFQLRFWHSLIEISASLAYLEMGYLDNAWFLADQAYKRELPYKAEKLSMHASKALGDFYRSVGNQEKAIEYYSENISTGVKNFQTTLSRYFLGVTLVDAGKRSEGHKWIDEAIIDARNKGFKGIESTMKMGRLLFGLRRKLSGNVIAEAKGILEQMRGLQNPQVNFFETSLKAFLFETGGNVADAITCYQQAIMPVNTNGNIWLELLGYERILKLAPAGNPAIKPSLKRIQEILELMQDHATYPLVKREFQKLRNKLRKYVNDVSTLKVYK